ncbi:PrsA/SurA chaperone [Candidatus Cyrtobacter comes]|uniref:Parvulin-like PPIase n=2 Tax=Candidatus Cyrtobacter comes TaxID=675776 RepID=A0ABU5L8Q3_9RICK|nr:PrsA/SurA chaperone [Candidatus Cyrtobacter comes]
MYCYAQEHKIVAIVESEIITNLDLKKRLDLFYFLNNIDTNKVLPDQELFLKKEALKSLVQGLIIRNKADFEHIEVTDANVSAALESFAMQDGGDIVTFHKKLRKMGIAPDDIKIFIKESLIKQLLLEKSVQKVEISRIELDSYLKILRESPKENRDDDVVRLAEVRIPIAQINKKEAQLMMEKISTSLSGGTSFENLLLTYGISKHNNGEIGWVQLRQLHKSLSSELSKATIDNIIGPVLLDDCIIIVKILDRKSGADFLQDKERYEKLTNIYLLTLKKNQTMSAYWTELFKSTCVQILAY